MTVTPHKFQLSYIDSKLRESKFKNLGRKACRVPCKQSAKFCEILIKRGKDQLSFVKEAYLQLNIDISPHPANVENMVSC